MIPVSHRITVSRSFHLGFSVQVQLAVSFIRLWLFSDWMHLLTRLFSLSCFIRLLPRLHLHTNLLFCLICYVADSAYLHVRLGFWIQRDFLTPLYVPGTESDFSTSRNTDLIVNACVVFTTVSQRVAVFSTHLLSFAIVSTHLYCHLQPSLHPTPVEIIFLLSHQSFTSYIFIICYFVQ